MIIGLVFIFIFILIYNHIVSTDYYCFFFKKISFRQAERKLKEMELETAQLRNKLTMVDKKLENGASKLNL